MIRFKTPITITQNAWHKLNNIVKKNNNYAFLFSAKAGGCNGFNYDLKPIAEDEFYDILNYNIKPNTDDIFYDEHYHPCVLKNNNAQLLVDPISEFLLLGTTIDYIKEDYNNNIYESKFVFTPNKKMATTSGCGISFNPKN